MRSASSRYRPPRASRPTPLCGSSIHHLHRAALCMASSMRCVSARKLACARECAHCAHSPLPTCAVQPSVTTSKGSRQAWGCPVHCGPGVLPLPLTGADPLSRPIPRLIARHWCPACPIPNQVVRASQAVRAFTTLGPDRPAKSLVAGVKTRTGRRGRGSGRPEAHSTTSSMSRKKMGL